MVQAFAPHAADQAFHIRILPRAPWRRNDLFHAHRRHGRAEQLPVCAVPVADQVPRRRAPRECFSDLLCDPRHRRVRRDTEMHDLAALVVEHDEPEQEVERGRGDHEEIDRRQAIGVICKECPPRLRSAAMGNGPCISRRRPWEMEKPSFKSSPWIRGAPVPSIYSIVPPNDGSALRHGHHFEPVDFVIDHGRGHHDAYSAGSCQRTYARACGCRQRPRRHREELIESERGWSGREAFVTMMQTADLGQGNDRSRPGRLNGSSIRCVLAERQVGP